MEHQRVVLDFVKAASFKEQSDVTLKLFAFYESFFKALHDSFFFICELVRIVPIYSREDRVGEFIFHTIDGNGVRFTIDLVQQFSIFEFERTAGLPLLFVSLRLDRIPRRLIRDRL